MLCLYVQAPFAVFRTFTAGSFRPTAEFITPSAAYGLLLNVAGIEMRAEDGDRPMTTIRQGLPKVRLALGALAMPLMHTSYQQLHNYPVGSFNKEKAERAKGSKYNIVPARRAFLSDIRGYICTDGNEEMEHLVRKGLTGKSPRTYGLLFLGDSNFLVDKLEPVDKPNPTYWFEQIGHEVTEVGRAVTRLTISIDREDMTRTTSASFAPLVEPSVDIPTRAWAEVGY